MTTATEEAAPVETPVTVQRPEFMPMSLAMRGHGDGSLDNFLDVEVTIAAELGRATLPLGELLDMGEGSVVELHRSVNDPVEIVAQGVRLARGEIVVVNDRFAVRILEISDNKQGQSSRTRNSESVRKAGPDEPHATEDEGSLLDRR